MCDSVSHTHLHCNSFLYVMLMYYILSICVCAFVCLCMIRCIEHIRIQRERIVSAGDNINIIILIISSFLPSLSCNWFFSTTTVFSVRVSVCASVIIRSAFFSCKWTYSCYTYCLLLACFAHTYIYKQAHIHTYTHYLAHQHHTPIHTPLPHTHIHTQTHLSTDFLRLCLF